MQSLSGISILADQTEVAVDFCNPVANSGRYEMVFSLCLPDESGAGYELLYTSGRVPPGLHLHEITLSRSLAPGSYDALLCVQPYRMDGEQTAMSRVDMKITLTAQEAP
jgi:hypothetical protein